MDFVRIGAQEINQAKRVPKVRKALLEKLELLIWKQVGILLPSSTREMKMEAFQEAVIGLLAALEKYDPSKVKTAAECYLIQGAKNAIRRFALTIAKRGFVTSYQNIIYKNKLDEQGRDCYLTKDGKWLTQHEVESWSDMVRNDEPSPKDNVFSLSATVKTGDEFATVEETIDAKVEFSEDAFYSEFARERLVEKFNELLKTMSQRDRHIVNDYFGIGAGFPVGSIRAIAKKYGLSHNGIHKIISKALCLFRKSLTMEEMKAALR